MLKVLRNQKGQGLVEYATATGIAIAGGSFVFWMFHHAIGNVLIRATQAINSIQFFGF